MNKRLKFAYSVFKDLKPGIGKSCSISKDAQIGKGTQICDNVVIMKNVIIGENCFILPGAIIGSKGFAFERDGNGIPIRITHVGGVIIGDNVEIGSQTCIISGTVDPTIIKNHVKIDTLGHVAHNCFIDEKTLITSGVLFGGSTKVGKECFFGTGSITRNKITIADYTLVGQGANVVKNITTPGTTVMGNPAKEFKK
jgi:UDP-3-O-[3-hydroxymyristoyl] glucosamine N-acyltransferase